MIRIGYTQVSTLRNSDLADRVRTVTSKPARHQRHAAGDHAKRLFRPYHGLAGSWHADDAHRPAAQLSGSPFIPANSDQITLCRKYLYDAVDRPFILFSFELSYLRAPSRVLLSGLRASRVIKQRNLLRTACLLCKMAMCHIEPSAAPAHRNR
jgi:hypothetical protein